jgi:hypothetical protein
MQTTMRLELLRPRRAAIALALAAIALALPRAAAAQEHHHGETRAAQIGIPEPMRVEHAEIHERLVAATKAPGRVGEAARALAAVLHPHFAREEQIALPPLGLLAPLARGEATPAMRAVLPMTDSLRAELPRMLEEHVRIRAATQRMGEVARAEANAEVAVLAESLALHARGEEEMFYPAAVLVGDLVRARTAP